MKPKDNENGLTIERLKYLLSYDLLTGIFTRNVTVCNSAKAGTVAGSIDKTSGYVRILIDGHRYLGHRLAWFYVHGEWPVDQLDHENRDRSRNAIENLREATNRENRRNSKVGKNNFLGIKCVRLHETGRYQARIFRDGRFKSLGLYDTPAEASQAYAQAATKLFGQFARAA